MSSRAVFATLALALALAAGGPARVSAQDGDAREVSPTVRVRQDTILRWAPRYVLDLRETPEGLEQTFWRRVDQIPIYERLTIDGHDLVDGWVDVHLSAWSVLDAMFGADEEGVAAGDFAVAHAVVHRGPVHAWAGRRFMPWGPPGGLHVDGGGAEVRTPFGLSGELFVGRPVTPRTRSILGPSTSFRGATAAYGGRVGYSLPGRVAASAAYVERWAAGIRADRILSFDATARPIQAISADTSVTLDVTSQVIEQASVDVDLLAARSLDLGVGYAHVEPAALLPAWSILSVFEASVYDEGTFRATVRPTRRFAVALDAGLRYHRFESDTQQDDDALGYRVGATVRLLPDAHGLSFRANASRRDDGVRGYTVVQASTAFLLWDPVTMAVEAAFAIDDDGERESFLGRVAVDAALSDTLRLGGTVDAAHTPITEAELRVLLRLTYQAQMGGGA